MKDLEKKLNELFVKNAPVQLPDNVRKWIADYAWIFALVGVLFGLIAASGILIALGLLSALGSIVLAGGYLLLGWVSFFALIAYVVVLGISVPKLKNKEPMGWDLTYYSVLAYFVYNLVWGFSDSAFGVSSNIVGLVWTVATLIVSLFILFQVRSYFKGDHKTDSSNKK